MIEYKTDAGKNSSKTIWSRTFLQPLAPQALGAFSSSLLTETVGRAWYAYYDRLGFDPAPKSRVVRWREGRPYVNLTLSAGLDAQHAGLEPVALGIDGAMRPLADWIKPGFLAGLKLGRGEQKIAATLAALPGECNDLTAKAQSWLQRVQSMRWSQAEILQIMEEIERTGGAVLAAYFAARHNLEYALSRLLALLQGESTQSLALVAGALTGVRELPEVELAQQVADLAALAADEPAAQRWLSIPATAEWQTTLPAGAFAEAFQLFMIRFGHRALSEGDLSQPRWSEDPQPVLQAVATCLALGVTALAPVTTGNGEQALLAAVDGKQRKEAQRLLQQLRVLLPTQSRALNAYAYVLAGTRRWALGAGREAMSDQRLLAVDDVFVYELEEMKEMMTGEWNISDRAGIHATAAERRAQLAAWQAAVASPLLVGDQPGWSVRTGLPGAPGQGEGQGLLLPTPAAVPGENESTSLAAGKTILTGVQPDSGWALWLPVAAGIAVAQGSLLDPTVLAAGALGVPVVIELGAAAAMSGKGAHIRLDGGAGTAVGL